MSFLHSHSKIGHLRLTPPAVVRTSNGLINNVSTATVTTAVQPIEGNLLIIQMGGVQTRTPSDLTGWTKVPIVHPVSGTDYYYWKIADASEPTSWLLSIPSSIQGGWIFYEVTGYDPVNWLQTIIKGDSNNISVAGFDFPAYNITQVSLALMFVGLHAASNTWIPTNSFTPATGNALNIYYKGAYRQYNALASGEVSGYTSANGRLVFGGIMIIQCRPIF